MLLDLTPAGYFHKKGKNTTFSHPPLISVNVTFIEDFQTMEETGMYPRTFMRGRKGKKSKEREVVEFGAVTWAPTRLQETERKGLKGQMVLGCLGQDTES